MSNADAPGTSGDHHDPRRFVDAQRTEFETALAEIRNGQKRTHWMWFIFPQFDGLGLSSTSRKYSIKSVAEARAYLDHPVLGPRLIECAEAVMNVEGRSALAIFGSPDDMKLMSCATLFATLPSSPPVFARLLIKYFDGQKDMRTIELVNASLERQPDHDAQ